MAVCGSPLLAEGGGRTVELEDAVRLGVDVYVRPWESMPVSGGVGVSYVPALGPDGGKRYGAAVWIGLDLPMYVVR